MGFRDVIGRLTQVFRAEPSVVFSPDTSLLSYPEMVPQGFSHGVEVLNDDTTPMQFVVDALRTHVELPETDAIRAMLEIHSKGGKLFPTENLERAQTIASAVAADVGERGYSLVCRAVSRASPHNTSLERTGER
jgi:ATP-dependent Clp protease adapter protein ClpS